MAFAVTFCDYGVPKYVLEVGTEFLLQTTVQKFYGYKDTNHSKVTFLMPGIL